ncbi:hypothetical protein ACOSP7_019358 [Xanthoceras sorbifolium]
MFFVFFECTCFYVSNAVQVLSLLTTLSLSRPDAAGSSPLSVSHVHLPLAFLSSIHHDSSIHPATSLQLDQLQVNNHPTITMAKELKRFPTLQADIAAAATEALERFREESRKTVLRLVDIESSYLIVEFFRKFHAEPERNLDRNSNKNPEKNAPPSGPNMDRYADYHFRKIEGATWCNVG